jgi:hypothetical protein
MSMAGYNRSTMRSLKLPKKFNLNFLKPRTRSERRRADRIEISNADLPRSVPRGSVCNVRAAKPGQLRSGDLVLVQLNGEYRARRFVRRRGYWCWLGGDSLTDLPVIAYSGRIFKVVGVYQDHIDVSSSPNYLVTFLHWFSAPWQLRMA